MSYKYQSSTDDNKIRVFVFNQDEAEFQAQGLEGKKLDQELKKHEASAIDKLEQVDLDLIFSAKSYRCYGTAEKVRQQHKKLADKPVLKSTAFLEQDLEPVINEVEYRRTLLYKSIHSFEEKLKKAWKNLILDAQRQNAHNVLLCTRTSLQLFRYLQQSPQWDIQLVESHPSLDRPYSSSVTVVDVTKHHLEDDGLFDTDTEADLENPYETKAGGAVCPVTGAVSEQPVCPVTGAQGAAEPTCPVTGAQAAQEASCPVTGAAASSESEAKCPFSGAKKP